ncbi:DUF1045 domain-containing protein [Sedimentitalea sp. JM2-8]|uniref:DUF1045 domain-containing protein n=1 Tax=Sedimentitalea xiamensis TaxID=3050037 RepID=A0ABT7FKV4_9RHOB|nr:DUF1045 domain-containing protein [Sedimentitalea xiamensis]MDK3075688.1 DUF1045 domain-containing protein [Sedimentitalea xiamensis]
MYQRLAVYFVPTGSLGAFGAAWLGWDLVAGRMRVQPDDAGLDIARVTEAPRRYGFHATIKPPFRMRGRQTQDDVRDAFAGLCGRLHPVDIAGLRLTRMGRFLALAPEQSCPEVMDLASRVVRGLDRFRAPLSDAELARRQKPGLTPDQARHLREWGYPHVMDQFRFHITLTGRLDPQTREAAEQMLRPRIAGVLPDPLRIDALTLVGEDADGAFHAIDRRSLGAAA